MSLLGRILVITLGLSVAGFVAGGAAGVVMMAFWMTLGGFGGLIRDPDVLAFGGLFGGMVGAVIGPIAAWLLMRSVPLGLAIGGTTLGTVAGALLGLLHGEFAASFYGAFVGFGAAAVALRLRTSRRALARADRAAIARAPQGM
jgi:hypothetical protein